MSIPAKSFNHAGLDGLVMMAWAGRVPQRDRANSRVRVADSVLSPLMKSQVDAAKNMRAEVYKLQIRVERIKRTVRQTHTLC